MGFSETFIEKDGPLITSQNHRIWRWAEHFWEQFSWFKDSVELIIGLCEVEWTIETVPLTQAEVDKGLLVLKPDKAAGSPDLLPALFMDGGGSLTIVLTRLLENA